MRSIVGNEGAGRNKHPLFRRIVSEKTASELAKSPPAALKVLKAAPHRAVRRFLRASYYHSAKICLSAHFAPARNLLGSAFPKPCYGGLRRLSPPQLCDNRKEVIPCERDTTRPTVTALCKPGCPRKNTPTSQSGFRSNSRNASSFLHGFCSGGERAPHPEEGDACVRFAAVGGAKARKSG